MGRNIRISRENRCTDPEALDMARAFMEDYQRATDMLTLLQNERSVHREIPGAKFSVTPEQRAQQYAFWEARAKEIQGLVDRLPAHREKMMLHYHYLLGYSVEAVAEVLDTSRSGAFRLKKRALEVVAALLQKRPTLFAAG